MNKVESVCKLRVNCKFPRFSILLHHVKKNDAYFLIKNCNKTGENNHQTKF